MTLNGENDASSITARTEPSKSTGSTMMLSGVDVAEPRVDRARSRRGPR